MQRVVAKISIPTPDGNHHQLFRYQFETADQRFNELRQFVQQKYTGDFVLRYKDDEGDLCTIGHEGDVNEALHTAQSMNAMLKIHVSGMKELTEPADLESSIFFPAIPNLVDDEMISEPVVEESAEQSEAANDIPELEEEVVAGQEEMPLVSFEEPAPQRIDPMERLFVATQELLKVYQSRFGVLLLVELNKILRLREIHPKNYPAEIAMIINTQNEFSDILQNPLYLDVVGPALFKVILPDEFIIRVNANASLLKQLDSRSIAEYADTMIGSLCASAGECKDKFTLRPSNVSSSSSAPVVAPPSVVPVNLDPLEPAPVFQEEKPKEQRGLLSTVLNSWPWGAEPKEEEADPVPFVEPDAPVVAPPRNASNTDFDILSFVDESLDNAREDEKASEERPSSLVMTPASHISYREAEDAAETIDNVPELVREDEPLEDEDEDDVEEVVEAEVESEVEVEDDEADDLKQSVVEEEEPRGRQLTHPNTLCSLCGMHPITGLRYKCMICSDMHMCQDCEMSGLHDRSHPVIKFATATQRLYAPHELSGLKDLVDPQYHTMFFTDIQVERAGEEAMNMSTYSAVSAASINPILMMRYMAESLRNPTALSRILDPIPNDDGESVSSASEFEVDVTVEEDVPDVRYQEVPNEASPEPEIEFPQDDDFEVAEASTDEVDFDVKVDADVEPVAVAAQVQPVIVEVDAEPAAEEVVVPQKVESVPPPQPQPQPQQAPQNQQQPPRVSYQPPQHQYPSMRFQYYAPPGMPPASQYPTQSYPPPPPYQYQQYYQYRQGPYQGMPIPAPQQQQQPRVPVQKPPPPPKQEEDLNDDFLLESQPEAVVEPAEKPIPKVVPVQPAVQPQPKPQIQAPRVNAQPQPQPAAQPIAKPPALGQAAAPSQNYVPPVVSNLPIGYPILKAPEEKKQQAQAKPKVAEPVKPKTELSCYCGVPLVKMPVGDLGSVVQCDVCNVKVNKGQVFHCFEQANHGSGGYDMCEGCVNHQIAGSRNDRLPQTTHAGPAPSDSVAPSAPPSAPPSAVSAMSSSAAATTSAVAPAVPSELGPHRNYKFFNGLVSLHEMGIGDVETNKKLLKIHKGNVSAVMQQYFDGNVSGYHY